MTVRLKRAPSRKIKEEHFSCLSACFNPWSLRWRVSSEPPHHPRHHYPLQRGNCAQWKAPRNSSLFGGYSSEAERLAIFFFSPLTENRSRNDTSKLLLLRLEQWIMETILWIWTGRHKCLIIVSSHSLRAVQNICLSHSGSQPLVSCVCVYVCMCVGWGGKRQTLTIGL